MVVVYFKVFSVLVLADTIFANIYISAIKIEILMLTIGQVTTCYKSNVVLRCSRKPKRDKRKGDYDPSTLEAIIYLQNIESEKDRDITILHELIHARDHIKSARSLDKCEDAIENEALATYSYRPYVLRYIRQLYKIEC